MEEYEKRLVEIAELVEDYDESEVDFENDDIDSLINDDEEDTTYTRHNAIPPDVVDCLIDKHTGEKRVKNTTGKSKESMR